MYYAHPMNIELCFHKQTEELFASSRRLPRCIVTHSPLDDRHKYGSIFPYATPHSSLPSPTLGNISDGVTAQHV